MNFSTLFRTKENLNLDKNTLTILRYIAISGQFIAVNIVFYYLKLDFPVEESYLIIFFGLLTNLFLQFKIKTNQLKDTYAFFFLLYDLLQLSILLFLTGGIINPFSILLIIPTIVSSTFLSMGTTIILGAITSLMLFTLSNYHFPLPGVNESIYNLPSFYKIGIFTSILIGLIFLSYFGIRFSGESKKRSEALNKLQEVIAKEYELESLGGQAAAAAHSLGTPLSTIKIIAHDLEKQFKDQNDVIKDIELLSSQVERCNEILKRLTLNPVEEDDFIDKDLTMKDYLSEIISSFKEISKKNFIFNFDQYSNIKKITKSIEIVYGLRNFIGNANKFSKENIYINLKSDSEITEITIEDDGNGYPRDILSKIGEPYLKSNYIIEKSKAGLGLGLFIGKTLLEKNFASVKCKNSKIRSGAEIIISWKNKELFKI